MKIQTPLQSAAWWCACFVFLFAGRIVSRGQTTDELAKTFASPPTTAAPQTWWHWVNGNITKEGITADLEAMQRVGLGGATIVNISGLPRGQVDFMGDAWRGMVQHAVRESARLGLELGVENCAGWSSSGGPWITPERAMQEVVFSEERFKGPGPFTGKLPQPLTRLGFYRDIAVLAYPTPAIETVRMQDAAPKITSNDPLFDWDKLSKPEGKAFVSLTNAEASSVQFEFAQPFEVRTVAMNLGANGAGDIQVSDDGQIFRTLRAFDFYSSNFLIGSENFEIPATSARFFRIVFHKGQEPAPERLTILQLDLRPAPGIDEFRVKTDAVRRGTISPAATTALPAGMAVDPGQVVNLTGHLTDDGRLDWTAPPGDWTIIRFGYTPTGVKNHPAPREGEGLECDKMSREAVKFHWDQMMAKIIADSGPLAGNTLAHTLIDSYEVGSQNWTAGMEREFQKRQGYDLISYLPVLAGHVVGGMEPSERVLWDFRRTVADLFAENYFDYMGELAHQSGLQLSAEPYGDGPFDNLLSGRNADVPMTEFWPPSPGSRGIKDGPMISHVYGHVLAGAESFTAGPQHTQQYPASLKALGDFAFTCGINHMSFHRYAHQPWLDCVPGMTAGQWGSNLERTNTWWEPGRAWIHYLTRCQYLLRQGRFVADALVLGREGSPGDFPSGSRVPTGHDWDGGNDDVVLHRLSMQNGLLTLPDGMSYRALLLPEGATMTPELLRKLRELANAGATIVGPKPSRSPSFRGYPQCDQEVKTLADELWASGKISTRSLEQVFDGSGLPRDFECAGDASSLQYIHRTMGKDDIYFVSNQYEAYEEANCFFRVTGKVPELWHPDTGLIEKAPVYMEEACGIRLPLRLDPIGSVFVVFREGVPDPDHPVSLEAAAMHTGYDDDRLQIQHAVFGSPADSRAAVDVTEKLAALVRHGCLHLRVDTTHFGDPAPMVVKQLQVQYVLNDKPGTVSVREGGDLNVHASPDTAQFGAARLIRATDPALGLEAWEDGDYQIRTARGETRRVQVDGVPAPLQINGPWNVAFPPNWGAPAGATFDKLLSWSDHPDDGIRHFSGTAVYTKTFAVPDSMTRLGHRVYVDLGKVEIIAEVKLNGKNLGIAWKPPYCVDATDTVQAGNNTLEVRVTNLWVNRLIGDEQLPPDHEWDAGGGRDGSGIKAWPQWLLAGQPSPTGRFCFTTWRHWFKDDPLLPSGLLGPVTLRASTLRAVPPSANVGGM